VFSGRALHVDFADCKTSLSHHGRQISESESEAQVTATGESQQRGSEETATGLSPQGGAEKEVDYAARQQPWFVRRFRPAQLGRGRLVGIGYVRNHREVTIQRLKIHLWRRRLNEARTFPSFSAVSRSTNRPASASAIPCLKDSGIQESSFSTTNFAICARSLAGRDLNCSINSVALMMKTILPETTRRKIGLLLHSFSQHSTIYRQPYIISRLRYLSEGAVGAGVSAASICGGGCVSRENCNPPG